MHQVDKIRKARALIKNGLKFANNALGNSFVSIFQLPRGKTGKNRDVLARLQHSESMKNLHTREKRKNINIKNLR